MSIIENLAQKFTKERVLYYPGCINKFVLKKIGSNHEQILTNMGIKFETLKTSEVCCGSPVLNAGYLEQYEKLIAKNSEILSNFKITKIITSCPACYKVFKTDYNFKVEHITQTIWNNIEKIKLKNYDNEEVSYHDPCYLGRHSGIYDEPRYILRALGFRVVELENNRENSFCCGGHGGFRANLPKISKKIAQTRLEEVRTNKIITACPLCYLQFKENSEGMKVLDISEVLL